MLSPAVPRYRAALAGDRAEVRSCQRLRAEVFRRGWRARLPFRRAAGGLDVDEWDELCDHVLVRDGSTGAVVATCRLLPPERAAALGRGHGDEGFDLTGHAAYRPDLVEAGRACLHPGHGGGAVVAALWSGVAGTVQEAGHRFLGGRMSIPLADGGATAAGTWDVVRARHLAPAALRVVPRVPYDVDAAARPARLVMPPLLRASLRIGAHVCGPPAHDAGLGTADLYVLLRMVDVPPRLRRPAVSA
ncbi:MAG: GNAT family N-acetyltransferase [Blastococcus sp.]|nr:GNAT family N-acetyltransferase [Blastococcus sp.]